jgi:hypothetical protein
MFRLLDTTPYGIVLGAESEGLGFADEKLRFTMP